MPRIRAALALTVLPIAAAAEVVTTPSGLGLVLQETRTERHEGLGPTGGDETWVRFRFLAPAVAEMGYAGIASEFLPLCEEFALPRLAAAGQAADVVIVSIEDRPVAFGEMDPEAVQFFESFPAMGAACEWDAF